MDCSLPGSSFHGIFQARILEWVAMSFARRSSQLRNWTRGSCIVGRRFTIWATSEVLKKLRPKTGRRRLAPPPWRANQPRVREGHTAAGRANRWGRAPGRTPAEVLGGLRGGWPSSLAAKAGVCLPGEAGGWPETWVREVGCVCAVGGFRGRRRRRGQGRCRGLRGTSERGVHRGGRATCPLILPASWRP